MDTNGYLELELKNKVKFHPYWVRQGGKKWCVVLGLVILIIIILFSTYAKSCLHILFHLIFTTYLNMKSCNY